jgi:tRNA(adenine34) deaminase
VRVLPSPHPPGEPPIEAGTPLIKDPALRKAVPPVSEEGQPVVDVGSLTATWMKLALVEAEAALATADVPVGAVVVDPSGVVIGTGRNAREARQDPTAHAELLALRSAAAALGTWRLSGCTLVVTLEPCAMCAGALVLARVSRLVLGAWDPKAGAAGSMRDIVRDGRLNHRVEVIGGVRAEQSAALLRSFFSGHR